MEPLQLWGLDLITAIQQVHGPALDSLFRAISFLGTEEFYLLLLPFFMWCVDFHAGARLTILLLFSSYVNTDLKDLLQQPRPFELDPGVKLAEANGYSLPSGHAQSAAAVWGGIAAWARRPLVWTIAIALAALVGLSRIYLGVHFPIDVLAGWAVGAALVVILLATQKGIQERLTQLRPVAPVALAVLVPIALILVHPTSSTLSAMATASGLAVGLALAARRAPFSAGGLWRRRLPRFPVGIIIVLALFVGLKAVLPAGDSLGHLALRFIRYWTLGLWVNLGAPWIFRRLKLA